MLTISLDKTEDMNQYILVTIIGLLDALLHDSITIVDAEVALFTPYSIAILNQLNIDTEIIELVEMGLELEDYDSLIPDKLEDRIKEIKIAALSKLKKHMIENQFMVRKKWLDSKI